MWIRLFSSILHRECTADDVHMCSFAGRFQKSDAQPGYSDNSLTAVSRLQQRPKGRVQDMVFLSPLDYQSVASEVQERSDVGTDSTAEISLEKMPQMPR